MTRYSHRNGETEPPTVAGRYWFDGYRTKHNGNRAHVRDMVEVNERGSVYNDVDGLTDEPHAYKGKWYGPIVAPWEQPAITPDVREAIITLCEVNEYHWAARHLRQWLDQQEPTP